MPFAGYEDFDQCVVDNADKNNPEAYCAAIQNEVEGEKEMGEIALKALDEDPCWDGYEQVGMKEDENGNPVPNCVPKGKQNSAMQFTLKNLDTQPIKRVELGGGKVKYQDMKLLAPGIWADAGSQQAAYYSPEGIRSLRADYDESKYNGPPVNIMHDVDMLSGETHAPSVAGYVDPKSLAVDDDDNLYGDIVLNTNNAAGAYADENLQGALESKGRLGFGGPSVEIPAKGLEEEFDEQRGMPRIVKGLLSGLGLVMNPASKTVSFAKEVARRGALLSGEDTKSFYLTKTLMDPDEARQTLESFGVDTSMMDDEEISMLADELAGGVEMEEEMDDDMMDDDMLFPDEEEEMMEMGDYEDEEEEEEMMEMEGGLPEEDNPLLNPDEEEDEDMLEMGDDPDEPMNADEDQLMEDMDEEDDEDDLANLDERVANLEDALSQVMSAGQVKSVVRKEMRTLKRRLSAIEQAPQEPQSDKEADSSVWATADTSITSTGVDSYTR
jgi:hypothetical protein